MRFEERELKPYAEPVSPQNLRVGKVYFAVYFVDTGGMVPVLDPKVFIGRNLEPDDSGKDKLYFQDFVSYQRGVRHGSVTTADEADFETGGELHMFEYERALDVLMLCAVRRRKNREEN